MVVFCLASAKEGNQHPKPPCLGFRRFHIYIEHLLANSCLRMSPFPPSAFLPPCSFLFMADLYQHLDTILCCRPLFSRLSQLILSGRGCHEICLALLFSMVILIFFQRSLLSLLLPLLFSLHPSVQFKLLRKVISWTLKRNTT